MRVGLLPLCLVSCATTTTPTGPTPAEPPTVTVVAGHGSDSTLRALVSKTTLKLLVKQRVQVFPSDGAVTTPNRAGARRTLEQTRQDYQKLRFAEAVVALGKAQAALAPLASEETDFRLLRQMAFQRGLCLLALKRDEEASESFATALNLGFSGPEPGQYPPEVERRVRQARDQLAGASSVGLTVKAQPRGSVVWVDGKRQDESPVTLQLSPGLHHIRVAQVGYGARTFFHKLTSGKSDRLEIFLKPTPTRELVAQLARRKRLTDLPPQVLARALGVNVALVEVTPAGGKLQAHLVWTGRERLSPGACPKGAPSALAACLDPLLRRLVTGSSNSSPAPAPKGPTPVYKRWWFWTLVGAGVAAGAGAGVGIYYGTRDAKTDVDIISTN